MTLGCGGYGGNITSDNISPRHLLNIKRLAYEISPAANRFERGSAAGTAISLPAAPPRPVEPVGVRADVLMQKIDQFLVARGFKSGSSEAIPCNLRRRRSMIRWQSRSSSSARKTCGSRSKRAENSSSRNGRSSRPPRAISAISIAYFL